MKQLGLLAALTSFFINSIAAADVTVSAKAGTLGFGVEATTSLSPNINLRFGANTLDYDFDETASDVRYDATLDYKNALAAIDWHPFAGTFRISAGAIYNGNEMRLTATPTANQNIGGTTYTPTDIGTLSGNVDFDSMAPYVGIGWSKSPKGGAGLGISVDIGVMYQGTPDVTLTSSTGSISDADLQREADEIEDDLGDVYPVVSVGFSFGF